MKTKPKAADEVRRLQRDLRNARIACKAALSLFRVMEEQGAIRMPFPGLLEVVNALKILVGEL